MADEEEEKKEKLVDKMKSDKGFMKVVNYVWDRRVEFFSGALMLVGIILAFYYTHIGGALVGIAFGLAFFDEIQKYFVELRDVFSEHGLFKTVMLIATILYFLISIPIFIISTAVGFAAMYILKVISRTT